MTSRFVSITVLVLALALTGCARKTTQSPPQAAGQSSTVATAASAPQNVPQPTAEFQPAFFRYDSYTLSPEARGALDQDAGVLREQPNLRVLIEGHCDERGTAEYNQVLGERRANAARTYLVAAGIDPGRIETISYGKERPFVDGSSESAWAQNRRAHVVLR